LGRPRLRASHWYRASEKTGDHFEEKIVATQEHKMLFFISKLF
jgi:hypothetical protein